ncbi:hypothetical protein I8752_05285 [Nostocaceae cyanobacterium CENA369]|uniref:Uncharacterized protein n=1 Tax=Dendronalium phyllosphericum CENA369 TaxID=1725256 RepID=A0A8J7I4P7_9NOST|nr:hypothetical protein [Dendronalium phyllosphericum]MBH8572457.1 hypothetical protein [Dendronalium phyllosphericum CENA369]
MSTLLYARVQINTIRQKSSSAIAILRNKLSYLKLLAVNNRQSTQNNQLNYDCDR